MKRIFFLFGLMLIFSVSQAKVDGNSGEYGFQLLKISSSTSNSAMANSGELISYNSLNAFTNPVSGIYIGERMASASNAFWIFDTSLSSFAVSSDPENFSFTFGMRYLYYGDLEGRDNIGTETGNFSPEDIDAIANLGYRITPDLMIGTTAHGLYEKIDTASSYGFSFDFGIIYKTFLKGLAIGSTYKNIGVTSKMKNESISLPQTIEIFAVKDFELKFAKPSLQIEAVKHSDDDNFKANIGLNVGFYDMLDLRVGYKANYDAESFSAGIGVKYSAFEIDYAFLPFNDEINDVHMVGILYKF